MQKRSVNGKKAALLYMLEALKDAGKSGKRLSQKALKEKLESVGVTLSDNTIRDNLQLLQNFFPELSAKHTTRFGHDTDWAIVQDSELDDSEWYFLMALVQSARRITTRERNNLLRALHELAPDTHALNKNYMQEYNVSTEESTRTNNFFFNLMTIGEAIEKCQIISFEKGSVDEMGNIGATSEHPHVYEVTPYRLISRHDSTFLLAIPTGESKLKTYTVELLQNVSFVTTKEGKRKSGTPLRNVKGLENFDFNHYIDTHLFSFGDPIIGITLQVKRDPQAFKALYFTFGDSAHVIDDDKNSPFVRAHVEANKQAMLYWALLYADLVEVIKPDDLREDILRALQKAEAAYKKRAKG